MAKTLNANQLLAKAIIKAVNVREASWISGVPGVNSFGHYKLTIEEACNKATSNKDRAAIVNILLVAAWNDALEWAQGIEEAP